MKNGARVVSQAYKVCFATLVGVIVFTATSICYAQSKPNIVLVFLDNFGWGEPGFNVGGITQGAETPQMDKLADEGLRLTNFNVETQCTPSRSARLSALTISESLY